MILGARDKSHEGEEICHDNVHRVGRRTRKGAGKANGSRVGGVNGESSFKTVFVRTLRSVNYKVKKKNEDLLGRNGEAPVAAHVSTRENRLKDAKKKAATMIGEDLEGKRIWEKKKKKTKSKLTMGTFARWPILASCEEEGEEVKSASRWKRHNKKREGRDMSRWYSGRGGERRFAAGKDSKKKGAAGKC